MSYALSSKAYKEYIAQMNQAYKVGEYDEAISFASNAIEVAKTIAFFPGIMPDAKNFYLKEIDRLLVFCQRISSPNFLPQNEIRQEEETKSKEPLYSQTNEKISLQKAKDKLNSLIGLSTVKMEVEKLISEARVLTLREKENITKPELSHHMVFIGNPGTGKTTVARLISQMFCALGLLKSGHLIETGREGLVAEYVGQTAPKTRKVLDSAKGGVLFIDEAYGLISSKDDAFGNEAVTTIVKYMEDNRVEFVAIAAGYADEQMTRFINANVGLKSRFTKFIHFDDYTTTELYDIFLLNCKKMELVLDDQVKIHVSNFIYQIYQNRVKGFGNGRTMRTLAEDIFSNLCYRIKDIPYPTKEELKRVRVEDIPTKIDKYIG